MLSRTQQCPVVIKASHIVFLSCGRHLLQPSPVPFPPALPHRSSSGVHPLFLFPSNPDIVHENLKMGSDGESDQASGTSSDEVQSPTGVCLRNRGNRRISAEVGLASFSFPSFFMCSHNKSQPLVWLLGK